MNNIVDINYKPENINKVKTLLNEHDIVILNMNSIKNISISNVLIYLINNNKEDIIDDMLKIVGTVELQVNKGIKINSIEMAHCLYRNRNFIKYTENNNMLFLFHENNEICYQFLKSLDKISRDKLTLQINDKNETFLFKTLDNDIINLLRSDRFNLFAQNNNQERNFLFESANLAYLSPNNLKYLFQNYIDINQKDNNGYNISNCTLLHKGMFNLLENFNFNFFNENGVNNNHKICQDFYLISQQGSEFIDFLITEKTKELENSKIGQETFHLFNKRLSKIENKSILNNIFENNKFLYIRMFLLTEGDIDSNIKKLIKKQREKLINEFKNYNSKQTEDFYENFFSTCNKLNIKIHDGKFKNFILENSLPPFNLKNYFIIKNTEIKKIKNNPIINDMDTKNLDFKIYQNICNNYILSMKEKENLPLIAVELYQDTKEAISNIKDKIDEIDWNKRLENGKLLISYCYDHDLFKMIFDKIDIKNIKENEITTFDMYFLNKSFVENLYLNKLLKTKEPNKEQIKSKSSIYNKLSI